MSQFLKLEITSIKNIYAGLYTSVVLVNYGNATSPSETVTMGKLSYLNYLNLADNIESYMKTNGKAPNYQSSQVGNLRFESLVYLYSQLLNYYNVVQKLPQYITVNPWAVVTNSSTVTFNGDQVISGAEKVQAYVEVNHKLPTNVTISGKTVSMPQFLELATTTLLKIDGGLYASIILGSYNLPTSSSETITGGKLNTTDYLNLARDVNNFIHDNGRAPNYQTTGLGNIRYESLVYLFSQLLSSYKANNYTLPDFMSVNPWSKVSSSSTVFFTLDQIENASSTVKSYVETNHKLPTSVTMGGTVVSMPQFLKLETTAVSYINGNLNASIVLSSYNSAPSPSETVKGGVISSTDYLSLADSIISFMNSNGRAPNYQTTSLGDIRYESLVFLYSQILDYYSREDKLPEKVTVDKWAVVSNVNKPFFNLDQIKTAASTVQTYVETNHLLPASVTIAGSAVSMPQFLQLAAVAVLNVKEDLFNSFVLGSYDAPPSPSESITNATFSREDYLTMASEVSVFMYANGRAPNYHITDSHGKLQYQSLVYLLSQILNSNNATNSLPLSITITPWATVSNSITVFITTDQLKTAAETVKAYVDANHQLPANVTIAGRTVSMPQFLKLSAEAVVNIENYLKNSLVLESVGAPASPTENLAPGTIYNGEFVDMAEEVLSYIDSNGKAPGNVTDTSLGSTMGYESLVYMFSEILISYNATEHPPDRVSVIPWLALSNPDGTFNFRTQEVFTSIQAAIDDTDTISGDTIWLAKSVYSENVTLNKKVIIRPVSGVDVTVTALNSALAVFTINTTGGGSIIQDLTITGANGNAGVYINNSSDNKILKNKITCNSKGVYIYNSTVNVVSGNDISQNTADGVLISLGSENEISCNQLIGNGLSGVNIQNSQDNGIYSNLISGNQDGILLNNSSTEVHYNSIAGNSRYGLYNQGNGTVDATDNWWGTNNPTVSSTGPSDIYVAGGTVTYNPWLVLNLKSSTNRSDRTGSYYNYLITADLTHNNQGEDTSRDGTVPDDIPMDFLTTLGTINSSESTRKGKVEVKLTSTAGGVASVSASLDQQTVTTAVNITSVDVLGVYNTRTGESFATIQEAVDDLDTINGDTITLSEGTYTENVSIDKRLTIKPAAGATVTVKVDDSDDDVFDTESVLVINVGGSGSTIQDLNIIGSPDSYGVALSHAFNVSLINNTISGGNRGVYLYQSGNNTLTGNNINNNYYGVALYQSTSNTITGGNITQNMNGIYLIDSDNNLINGTTINDNWYGTYLYHSNGNTISGSTVEGNWVGMYLYNTNNNLITGNQFTANGVGVTYYNSLGITLSNNTFTDNWLSDTSVVDSGEMVLATTIYSCGPAALATVLKNLGIYTTEAELATLAGTDETGTSLYGLKVAAQAKGATAIGVRLTTDQLKANYIVVLEIDGTNHFEVVKNITSTTVTLIDPNLGTIEMSLEKFNKLYTGVALIINGSAPAGAIILSDDELKNIKAMYHMVWVEHKYYVPGYYYYQDYWIDTSHWELYWYEVWVPGYWFLWWYIEPHTEWRLGLRWVGSGFSIRWWYFVPGHIESYWTYEKVYDYNWENEKHIASGAGKVGLYLFGSVVMTTFLLGHMDHL